MKDGFIKVAAISAATDLGNQAANLKGLIELTSDAASRGAKILLMPRLCLCGATLGDLYYNSEITERALCALCEYLKATESYDMLSVVGLPMNVYGRLFAVSAVCHKGRLTALIPHKLCDRQFDIPSGDVLTLSLFGYDVPFGRGIPISIKPIPELAFTVMDAEELLSVDDYAAECARRGVNVILAPAIFKASVYNTDYPREALKAAAERLGVAIVAASASGESGNDYLYLGKCGIIEGAREVAWESDAECMTVIGEIDIGALCATRYEKYRMSDFAPLRPITVDIDEVDTALESKIEPHPFLVGDMDKISRLTIDYAARALSRRMKRAGCKKLVLGLSGGLDSTLAYLICHRAFEIAGENAREGLVIVTMPCFGTGKRTRGNAEALAEALDIPLRTVDIKAAVSLHLEDIGHTGQNRDVAYENAQARERTQVLMDIANAEGGIVVGTGDLSEAALGFATYNGDHMSMYSVNATIPKTLMRAVLENYAKHNEKNNPSLATIIRDILDTPVSPELLPPDKSGNIAQCTEDIVGPYELHDFFIWHIIKDGASPRKLYRMACAAFDGVYECDFIKHTLRGFIRRFFNSQFKRSCSPDGVAVTDISFSPRGAWSMPSDASAKLMLDSLD